MNVGVRARFLRGPPRRIVPVVVVHLIDGTFELFRYFRSPAAAFDRSAPEGLRAVHGVVASILRMLEGGVTHLGVATLANFKECSRLLPDRADSERSWTVTRREIEAKGYDLKAVNPNARSQEDRRTQDELLDLIEAKGGEVAEAIAALRAPRKNTA